MDYTVCAIKDRAIDAYLPIFTARTKSEAVRMFQNALNDKQSQMAAHPEDYDLFYLGTWTDTNGAFHQAEQTELLVMGRNLVNRE